MQPTQIRPSVSRADSAQEAQSINELLVGLRAMTDQEHLHGAYATGEMIVGALYGGSVANWRRRPKKDVGYEALKAHPNLPLSRQALYRGLRVYDVCDRIPDILASHFLTLSHVIQVMALGEGEQRELLRLAEEGSWSVRRLRKRVEERQAASATGRPRTCPTLRAIKGLLAAEGSLENCESLLRLAPQAANELLDGLRRIQPWMARVETVLSQAASPIGQARVLLVHENRPFALRLRRYLLVHVRSIRLAHSHAAAVRLVEADTSCAIIHFSLPGRPAEKLCEALRRVRRELPCIFIVSRGEPRPHPLAPANSSVLVTSRLADVREAVVNVVHSASATAAVLDAGVRGPSESMSSGCRSGTEAETAKT